MIRGIHGLFYSSDPEATRAFFRDKVKLPGSDIGGGWWIFDLAEGDLGVHPADEDESNTGEHDISFYCDDIDGTVAELEARGVRFTDPIMDRSYGRVTYFTAPGGVTVQLYEPRYEKGTMGKRGAAANRRAPAKRAAPKRAAPKRAAARRATPKRVATGRSTARTQRGRKKRS